MSAENISGNVQPVASPTAPAKAPVPAPGAATPPPAPPAPPPPNPLAHLAVPFQGAEYVLKGYHA
ncbi:MAG: hypothetical protein ACREIC_25280, partial [Limisphaerales bacterium]